MASAASQIEDADMAKEMSEMTKFKNLERSWYQHAFSSKPNSTNGF